jgi:serine/threonine-protein kinase SRPK3
MPQLDEMTEQDLIDRFDPPECTIVFHRQTPARLESLPLYLVPPTQISKLLLKPADGLLLKPAAELHIELLDLGNGMH